MRTRESLKPRRIGRLAPGAKVDEVAPGCVKNTSPKFCVGVCWICPLVMVPSGA
jgi:hypothetical protein